jgi:hypothetical protein
MLQAPVFVRVPVKLIADCPSSVTGNLNGFFIVLLLASLCCFIEKNWTVSTVTFLFIQKKKFCYPPAIF